MVIITTRSPVPIGIASVRQGVMVDAQNDIRIDLFGQRRAFRQGQVCILRPAQMRLPEADCFQLLCQQAADREIQVFFREAGRADPAGFRSAMAWIDQNNAVSEILGQGSQQQDQPIIFIASLIAAKARNVQLQPKGPIFCEYPLRLDECRRSVLEMDEIALVFNAVER